MEGRAGTYREERGGLRAWGTEAQGHICMGYRGTQAQESASYTQGSSANSSPLSFASLSPPVHAYPRACYLTPYYGSTPRLHARAPSHAMSCHVKHAASMLVHRRISFL